MLASCTTGILPSAWVRALHFALGQRAPIFRSLKACVCRIGPTMQNSPQGMNVFRRMSARKGCSVFIRMEPVEQVYRHPGGKP